MVVDDQAADPRVAGAIEALEACDDEREFKILCGMMERTWRDAPSVDLLDAIARKREQLDRRVLASRPAGTAYATERFGWCATVQELRVEYGRVIAHLDCWPEWLVGLFRETHDRVAASERFRQQADAAKAERAAKAARKRDLKSGRGERVEVGPLARAHVTPDIRVRRVRLED